MVTELSTVYRYEQGAEPGRDVSRVDWRSMEVDLLGHGLCSNCSLS